MHREWLGPQSMLQLPPAQIGVPPGVVPQVPPQRPQLVGSPCRSTHLPPQQVRLRPQAPVGEQGPPSWPATQVPPAPQTTVPQQSPSPARLSPC